MSDTATLHRLHDVVLRLLDSADDTGCSDDLIVVSKTALRDLAEEAFDGEPPAWLKGERK